MRKKKKIGLFCFPERNILHLPATHFTLGILNYHRIGSFSDGPLEMKIKSLQSLLKSWATLFSLVVWIQCKQKRDKQKETRNKFTHYISESNWTDIITWTRAFKIKCYISKSFVFVTVLTNTTQFKVDRPGGWTIFIRDMNILMGSIKLYVLVQLTLVRIARISNVAGIFSV